LKTERFKLTFQKHDLNLDDHLFAQRYLELLPDNVVLIDGALNLCENLKKHGEIAIITNGIEMTQKKRIENSSLKNYIDYLSVSEECGSAKPSTIFFEFTASKVKYFSKNETIMIGDRLETDILGAQNFGIDSFWFNPENSLIKNDIYPTYETNKLKTIYRILNS
jgi:2-haloacid dehalogenase